MTEHDVNKPWRSRVVVKANVVPGDVGDGDGRPVNI